MGRNRIQSWSWKDVVETAPRIGIPHFQRGSVWDASNRVALLESMFDKSPCGSLVTWQPKSMRDEEVGVPLLDGQPLGEKPLWLVDGQQRCRSLVSIFQDLATVGARQRADQSLALLPADVVSELLACAPWIGQGTDATPADGSQTTQEVIEDVVDEGYGDEVITPAVGRTGWFVCLGAIPELRKELTDKLGDAKQVSAKQAAKYSMFRTVAESVLFPQQPSDHATRVQLPRLLMPLGLLIAPRSCDQLKVAFQRNDPASLAEHAPWVPFFLTGRPAATWAEVSQGEIDGLRSLFEGTKFPKVAKRFKEMFTHEHLAVGPLPRASVQGAISAYVRINRAGIRVQAEERALAVLAKWHSGILTLLAEFARARDGEADVRTGIEARKLLGHSSEKTFGFALWMRTVVRFVVLRVLSETAQQWTGPDAIERWTVGDKFDRLSEKERAKHVGGAAEHAGEALLLVDSLLSSELAFDHRMARPNTRALIPILDLLAHINPVELKALRTAEGRSDLRALLARGLHLTMLHPYLDQAELNGLCDAVHLDPCADDSWPVDDGMTRIGERLESYIKRLHKLWSEEVHGKAGVTQPTDVRDVMNSLADLATASFHKLVTDARSLQAPAVGWLYAIERRNRATEFDWAAQKDGNLTMKWPPDLGATALDAACAPEKQHIVPFADAKKIADKGGTRATASPANAVGNLTWLSARQNGFTGFSQQWAVLSPERDEANLRARGLLSGEPGARAVDHYKTLKDLPDGPERGELFRRFCEARIEWMKEEMRSWLTNREELDRVVAVLRG